MRKIQNDPAKGKGYVRLSLRDETLVSREEQFCIEKHGPLHTDDH